MKQPIIRVLHIVGIMNQGGIETLLMNLYRNIDRSIVQFDFLVHSNNEGYFNKEIISLGGKIYSIINPFSLKGMFQYNKELSSFFKKHTEYTIVHSHMNTFSGIILSVAKNAGVNIRIAHSHATGISNPIRRPMGIIAKHFGEDAITNSFACSRDAAKWNFNKTSEKTYIFKNTIDIEKYRFSKKTRMLYRNKLGLKNKHVVGHIGRFDKIKNHSFLIDIHAKLIKKQENTVLLLIGEGPLLTYIQKKVHDLNIDNSVIFLGNRNDVEKLLCAMDLFILPSINEGLGIVAIEAQTSGLPCFVSDALPPETKVSSLLNYLPLSKGTDYWASYIQEKITSRNRDNAYIEVKKQDYDIKKSAEWLKNFYISQNKESK